MNESAPVSFKKEKLGKNFLQTLFERYRTREWVQEVDSLPGLAQALENKSVKAAVYTPPDNPSTPDFNAVLARKDVREFLGALSFDELLKQKERNYSYPGKTEENDAIETVINFILDDIRTIRKAFPRHAFNNIVVRTREKKSDSWHNDTEYRDTGRNFALARTYNGLSTEYALDKEGRGLITFPEKSITMHRMGKRGPIHRGPHEDGANERFAIVFVLYKRHWVPFRKNTRR